jgi:hypothetical protein
MKIYAARYIKTACRKLDQIAMRFNHGDVETMFGRVLRSISIYIFAALSSFV